MSMAATGTSGRRVSGGQAAPGLAARLTDPTTLLMVVMLTAAVGALFHNWFYKQHLHSWGSPDWSHAYLIPLISGYLVWHNRAQLARTTFEAFWPGIVPLVMGIAAYVYFLVGPSSNHLGQGLALVLTIFGITLLLLGPRAMLWLFLPIAYLGFAITVPEKIMNFLTYPLQDLAARGGWVLLNTCGFKADLQGNVIHIVTADLSTRPLNVAEQCSGMRMVVAFTALGAAVALVGSQAWWKRVVLLAMAIPIAVGLNVVRVAVLGMLTLVDPNLASGQSHMLIGTLLLLPGFLLYMGVLVALNKAAPEPAEVKGAA